jgi:hypothetical protein
MPADKTQIWLKVASALTIGFGLVIGLAAYPPTAGLTLFLTDLIFSPRPRARPHAHFGGYLHLVRHRQRRIPDRRRTAQRAPQRRLPVAVRHPALARAAQSRRLSPPGAVPRRADRRVSG